MESKPSKEEIKKACSVIKKSQNARTISESKDSYRIILRWIKYHIDKHSILKEHIKSFLIENKDKKEEEQYKKYINYFKKLHVNIEQNKRLAKNFLNKVKEDKVSNCFLSN